MIVCYIPVDDAEEESKDSFYEHLQAASEDVKPIEYTLLIIGDLNASVVDNYRGIERFTGRHGCGTTNDNGEWLCDFCEENDKLEGHCFNIMIFTRQRGHRQMGQPKVQLTNSSPMGN